MRLSDLTQPYTPRHWKRVRRILRWFFPVSRRRMERELAASAAKHAEALEAMRQRHRRDLTSTTKAADALIRRASSIQFDSDLRHGYHYALQVTFSPRLVSAASCDRRELEFIAKRVALQVEQEIATSRFVQSAYDRFREREDEAWHPDYVYDTPQPLWE